MMGSGVKNFQPLELLAAHPDIAAQIPAVDFFSNRSNPGNVRPARGTQIG